MIPVLSQILKILEDNGILYEHMTHEYVHRSKEASRIRGTRYEEAAKALVLFGDSGFILAVVPGPAKADYSILKKELGIKKLCLANPEQVLQTTNLTIGSIPPFGSIFGMPVFIEKSILNNDFLTFSAGTHHDTIRMRVEDYLKIVPHRLLDFRK